MELSAKSKAALKVCGLLQIIMWEHKIKQQPKMMETSTSF